MIAKYIRLSREDGDKNESLSVEHQRLLIQQYLSTHEELRSVPDRDYIDDGYSGTNFERPAFKELIDDVKYGKIDTIIVKDLSRLGRNMPKVSEYIQDFFPKNKVRFIAIDDHIDKKYYDCDFSEDMLMDIKNLFNGFYPKDISKKVRSTLRAKQQSGQFIGAFACYGYQKDPLDHNHLIVDPDAAKIVKFIFSSYLSGTAQTEIARILDNKGIPSPTLYKQLCGQQYHNHNTRQAPHWSYSSIRNILRNPIYTGKMVQNKTFRRPCTKKAMPLHESQWICVENTHEAIISKNTFQKVQNLLHSSTRPIRSGSKKNPFSGLIFCGDCGCSMIKTTYKNNIIYRCGGYNRYGKEFCTPHSTPLCLIEEKYEQMAKTLPTDIINKQKNKWDTPLQVAEATHLMHRETILNLIKQIRIYKDQKIVLEFHNFS